MSQRFADLMLTTLLLWTGWNVRDDRRGIVPLIIAALIIIILILVIILLLEIVL